MPVLPPPPYRPPFPFTSGHLQTLYPTLCRRTPSTDPTRERIETPDGDFIDVDWHYSRIGLCKGLAVVSHGLEGHSRKKYPLGMARCLSSNGWDVRCLDFITQVSPMTCTWCYAMVWPGDMSEQP